MREVYKHQTKARILANDIIKMNAQNRQTIADSAAKRFNDTMREYGLRILDAKKGPDSVERGETWLSELDRIVIDPKRTPNIAKEFENIDFATSKDGEPLPRLVDKNNHTINISVVYKRREIPRTLKRQLERKLVA